MMSELKSEFLKLTRTRSTYGVLAFALVLEGIFAFWANGFKANPLQLHSSSFLQSQISDAISALGLIGAFAAVLLVTQEYRYNTIMYTLTTANRRWKVLAAKFLVITGYAVLFTLFMGALSPLLTLAC
jgi:ABC-type transport system involved in multi-copper enzyme maturation permease subunit